MRIKPRSWWLRWLPVICWKHWRRVRPDSICDGCWAECIAKATVFKFEEQPTAPSIMIGKIRRPEEER